MSSVQVRTASPRAPVTAVDTSARLELLEYFLVHHEDLTRCAQASLDWLARYCNIRRSVCLAVDAESSTLVGLAGYGVRTEALELFSWPISDGADALMAALSSALPTPFRGTRANGPSPRNVPQIPLGVTGPFVVHPLRGSRP